MSKEYIYTKQHLIDIVQQLKDYTKESRLILGNDEREAIKFVDIFLNELDNKKEQELLFNFIMYLEKKQGFLLLSEINYSSLPDNNLKSIIQEFLKND